MDWKSDLAGAEDAPLLLLVDTTYRDNPFGLYLSEILKTEGFLAHRVAELSELDLPYLRRFPLVVLAEARLQPSQRQRLRDYVAGGGRLLAMRPDPELADLFGLSYLGPGTESLLQYLAVAPDSEIAHGLEPSSLQYHGVADSYLLASASAVAWLYEGEASPSSHPAVAFHRYGSGSAVAFCYDLARSVALMRQGNPDWACGPEVCEDGDGFPGIRPVDSFLRQSGESWVNPAKIPIPQADEQQRLLSHCLNALAEGAVPLPRLWYLPEGKKAALVLTGDGDDIGFAAFDQVIAAVEEYGGHFSAYLHHPEGDPTREQVEEWIARGHEVSTHVEDKEGAVRPTLATLSGAYARAVEKFVSLYGRQPGPTERNHCITWYGWVEGAEIALSHGLKVDFNYYHGRQWHLPDGSWVNGYFTGSGLPQRYVRQDGTVLDIYQLLTQWADETQLWRQELGTEGAAQLVREMLDAADRGYYSVFVANFHPGGWKKREVEPWGRAMMAEALSRGIPLWSGEDLYRFLAARDGACFSRVAWDGARLSFLLRSEQAPAPLSLMLPAFFNGRRLGAITCDGAPLSFEIERVSGHDYALAEVAPGSHEFTADFPI